MSVEEYGEVLDEIEAMVQRSINYWKAREDNTDSTTHIDAYRCIQTNIKTIKDEILTASATPLPVPEGGFDEHCFCNRGIRQTPNEKRYCPVHGYDYQSLTSKAKNDE